MITGRDVHDVAWVSGRAKAKPAADYVLNMLEQDNTKLLVFGHHKCVVRVVGGEGAVPHALRVACAGLCWTHSRRSSRAKRSNWLDRLCIAYVLLYSPCPGGCLTRAGCGVCWFRSALMDLRHRPFAKTWSMSFKTTKRGCGWLC